MLQRGRKSPAQLATPLAAVLERPHPPECLNAEEAEEWRAIVKRMPPDWFTRETWPILETLCCHIVDLREIDAELRKSVTLELTSTQKIEKYKVLVQSRKLIAHTIVVLATKLRLTPQSRYGSRTALVTIERETPQPWEAHEET